MEGNTQAQISSPQIIALMYHRVDTIDTDPWGTCVSPARFEEQVQFLKNNFNVISSEDLIAQVTTGNIIDKSVCITFDDGYADNYIHAKPILEKYNCPATFFIATAFINQTKPFLWDELKTILLHSKKLVGDLSLKINGTTFKYSLDENELTDIQWQKHTSWKWHEEPPTDRCAAYLDIWQKLRPLFYVEIERQMIKIRNWANSDNNTDTHSLPMNEQQLHELSKSNLFSIGIHTHTHPDMEGKEKHFQVNEIISCKKILSTNYKTESNCLAYPYGKYNDDTIKVVKELKVAGCFTTAAGPINKHSDLAALNRYQVFNREIAYFKDQLNNIQ